MAIGKIRIWAKGKNTYLFGRVPHTDKLVTPLRWRLAPEKKHKYTRNKGSITIGSDDTDVQAMLTLQPLHRRNQRNEVGQETER